MANSYDIFQQMQGVNKPAPAPIQQDITTAIPRSRKPFDPDAYLAKRNLSLGSSPSVKQFDPDKYLAKYKPELLDQPPTEPMSAGEAFARASIPSVAPALGGLATMGAGAPLIASAAGGGTALAGPVGGLVAGGVTGLALMFAGSMLTGKAQDVALKKMLGDDKYKAMLDKLDQARTEQPMASTAGELAAMLPAFKPSPSNVSKAAGLVGKLYKLGKAERVAYLASKTGQNELANLSNVAVGGGLGLTTEGIQQIQQGDFQPIRLLVQGTAGLLLNDPTKLGTKLTGQKPINWKENTTA